MDMQNIFRAGNTFTLYGHTVTKVLVLFKEKEIKIAFFVGEEEVISIGLPEKEFSKLTANEAYNLLTNIHTTFNNADLAEGVKRIKNICSEFGITIQENILVAKTNKVEYKSKDIRFIHDSSEQIFTLLENYEDYEALQDELKTVVIGYVVYTPVPLIYDDSENHVYTTNAEGEKEILYFGKLSSENKLDLQRFLSVGVRFGRILYTKDLLANNIFKKKTNNHLS